VEVLLLPVGEEIYSVPIQAFREVVVSPRVTRLPAARASLLGLINVRGEIIPLLDLAALIGTGATKNGAFAAVVDTPSGLAAVATTEPPSSQPLGNRTGASALPGARGVYTQGDRLAVLLDLDAVIAGLRR
jgi:chemotaxis signal transduction protein